MSEFNQPPALVAALEAQFAQLSAIVEIVEHRRRGTTAGWDDLQWTGPASAAYLGARWLLDRELAAAVDALAAARDSTATALHTLEKRG